MKTVVVTFTLIGIVALGAQAADRNETLRILESIRTTWSDANLQAWLNDEGTAELRIGSSIEYHFGSDRDAYLTALHIDGAGKGTLIFPSGLASGNKLTAGVERTFPGARDPISIEAQPPLGEEVVYFIASKHAVSAQDLGVSFSPGEMKSFDAQETTDLARRLKGILEAMPPHGVAITPVRHRLVGRGIEYTAGEITRSLRRQKASGDQAIAEVPFHLSFDFGSTDLIPAAQTQLDELARVLSSSFANQEVVLGGHTDDVGDAGYNLELSRHRAAAAKQYLVEHHSISPTLIGVRAYGESSPRTPGTSEAARAHNRRVVLEISY